MSTHNFKVGDIVRYVPRHPVHVQPRHKDKIAIVCAAGKGPGELRVIWAPDFRESDDWGVMPENLDLLGHIDS